MNDPTDSEAVSIVRPTPEEYARRTVTVDFLYLNNESCDRCMGTEAALETALRRVGPILDALDVGITVRDVHVSTLAAAEAAQLAVSPTIRIGGRDIQPEYLENTCESCGDLCACEGAVDCRRWRYRGEEHSTAPVGLLVEKLVRALAPNGMQFDDPGESQAYQLSSNVRGFFESSGDDESDCGCGC
ncbi:DUF2703 domain-containing protein [Halobellus rarus]|uniref:DUF2703 domain-containing protein n=1 Tax=Halobellus rarus TaxID=1126237 RepID=A0ABD6CP98_9EURY|nr:DUF2703 domain-containing protein [Halobellus rarus]